MWVCLLIKRICSESHLNVREKTVALWFIVDWRQSEINYNFPITTQGTLQGELF